MATRKKVPAYASVAGAAPLALALLVGNAVLPSSAATKETAEARGSGAVKCADDITDFRDCHSEYPTGCSAAGRYDAYLNLLKNSVAPSQGLGFARYLQPADITDLEQKIPAELAKTNHAQYASALSSLQPFAEQQHAGVVGYLYYAQATGAESSNCQLTAADDVDYHIGIGFDPELAATVRQARLANKKLTAAQRKQLTQTAMVVEMTPHYRAWYQPNWTLDALKAQLGEKVRVEGQLIVDSEHHVASQDCGMAGADQAQCWRATAWELHPVQRFQVCSGRCEEASPTWVELDAAAVALGP